MTPPASKDVRRLEVSASDLMPGDRLVARWQDGKWVLIKGRHPSVIAEATPLEGRMLVKLTTDEKFSCPLTLPYKVDRETP